MDERTTRDFTIDLIKTFAIFGVLVIHVDAVILMQGAIGYFDKILKLDSSDVEARYQLGRCYHYLADFEKARQCYTYIIDNHSGSEYYSDAQKYLNELNKATSQN